MRRRGALRSGNRAWKALVVALTGCLLAVGLTACPASKLSIAWDDSSLPPGVSASDTTMTVPAGFQGQLKINWSGNGSCRGPELEIRGKGAPVVNESVVGFVETGNGYGYFFVKGNNDGQYNSLSLLLECDPARSNLLKITIADPVDILIVHPSGLDPLPQGMIQTRGIDGSFLGTETYKAGEKFRDGVEIPKDLGLRPGFQYIGRAIGVLGQQVRVTFKPHPGGKFWTGTCPSSTATFVVRPGDQVDNSGYASPSCDFSAVGSPGQGGFSDRQVDEVMVRAVTPLAVMVFGPSSSRGLYGIRVGSADAGGFRPTAEVCASTRSTSCTARVVPGDTVTVGLKPPTEAGVALQGTCPSGATFQITSSSVVDDSGYATACPSFTPTDSTTDISVQKVPVQSFTVTGPVDRLGLFGVTIVSAPPGGSNVTPTVCTDTTKACTATFPQGGSVAAGFKPPSEGTLVGTCPGAGWAFTINAASLTDDSGYHFPCLSFTPTETSTTLTVSYEPPYVPPPTEDPPVDPPPYCPASSVGPATGPCVPWGALGLRGESRGH